MDGRRFREENPPDPPEWDWQVWGVGKGMLWTGARESLWVGGVRKKIWIKKGLTQAGVWMQSRGHWLRDLKISLKVCGIPSSGRAEPLAQSVAHPPWNGPWNGQVGTKQHLGADRYRGPLYAPCFLRCCPQSFWKWCWCLVQSPGVLQLPAPQQWGPGSYPWMPWP